jgi:hypothetical protein
VRYIIMACTAPCPAEQISPVHLTTSQSGPFRREGISVNKATDERGCINIENTQLVALVPLPHLRKQREQERGAEGRCGVAPDPEVGRARGSVGRLVSGG